MVAWQGMEYGGDMLKLSMIEIYVSYNSTEPKDSPRGYRYSINGRRSKALFRTMEDAKHFSLQAASDCLESDLRFIAALLEKE